MKESAIKNVIIINDFAYINGGAGKVALSTALELANYYKVYLLTAVEPIADFLKTSSVNVICLGQKDILNDDNRLRAVFQGLWNRKAYKTLVQLLKQLPDHNTVIHYHGWTKSLSPSLLSATSRFNHKVVFTLHDYFLCCPNGGFFNYKKKKICDIKAGSINCLICNCDVRSYPQKVYRYLRHLIQRYYYKKLQSHSIIYISQLNKSASEPYLSREGITWHYLKNPIDLNRQSVTNIENNDTYLYIGRLSSEKGVDMFCRAINDLGLKGRVLGDGYLLKTLKEKYPKIEFCGWKDGQEKESIIHQAKALIFPSLWYEGAPLTIHEIQSYGIPCIVPDRCAAAETVIDNQTGFIFTIGDLQSLKNAILRCQSADLRTIQKQILSSFNPSDYSMTTHIRNLIEIYKSL